ncbi:MAG: CotH kinase family protein [Flavobacteriales bacterium]|nr:CotH kinase family protein [Flavobacteriales bacterium]
MRQRKGPATGPWLLAVLFVPPLVMALLLGPARASRIAMASAATAVLERMPPEEPVHRIPVIDIEVDPATWNKVAAGLPWSGDQRMDATLVHEGMRYPGSLKFRGAFATTHYLGNKKSFRINLKRDNPFAPCRRLNVVNPKAQNMVNAHMALWLAARMGVLTPYDELVFLRRNGEDVGVMELYEQIGGDVLRNRHLATGDVPVFRGDYPPITGRQLPPSRPLWARPEHWAFMGDADSTAARARLAQLLALVRRPVLTDAARDSLASLIDVEAFLRFSAAITVAGTTHIDNYHNQWLVEAPGDGRFHPVFWDALLLYGPDTAAFYPIHDALAHHLLSEARWRLQRDRYVHEALDRHLLSGDFHRALAEVCERIRPSMLADRNKNAVVSDQPQDVYRISALHVAASADKLAKRMHAHARQLSERQRIEGARIQRSPADISLNWEGPSAMRITWTGDTAMAPNVEGEAVVIERAWNDGVWNVVLAPRVEHSAGTGDKPFTDGQQWLPRPTRVFIRFSGPAPQAFTCTHAVTGEVIHAGR